MRMFLISEHSQHVLAMFLIMLPLFCTFPCPTPQKYGKKQINIIELLIISRSQLSILSIMNIANLVEEADILFKIILDPSMNTYVISIEPSFSVHWPWEEKQEQ